MTFVKKEVETFGFAFHSGHAIMYLAQIYSDPFAVLKELVQNALDKRAKNVLLYIDCYRSSIVRAYDDGLGASKEEITKKFKNIADSLKVGDLEAFGQKGIGNLAGIAIANGYKLVTKDQNNSFDEFRVYYFDKEDIKNDPNAGWKVEKWPAKTLTQNLSFTPSTMVELSGITEMALRHLADLPGLERVITDAFNRKISKDKVEVKLIYRDTKGKTTERKVKALGFSGMRMDPVEYDSERGKVEFDFFYSNKPQENPRVLIEHKGTYSINLFNLVFRKQLSEEIAEIYRKGYFEGLIKLPFCTLAPSRDSFEWDNELSEFLSIIERFAKNVLEPLIEAIEDAKRQDRYQQISDAVLKKLSELFKSYPKLFPPRFHTNINVDVIKRPKKNGGKKERRESINKNSLKEQKVKSETNKKTTDQPVLATGNKLKEGLLIRYEPATGEGGTKWRSRTMPEGIIAVNILHSDYRAAEKLGKSRSVDYVFTLVVKELTCGSLESTGSRIFSEQFENIFMNYWRANLIKAVSPD